MLSRRQVSALLASTLATPACAAGPSAVWATPNADAVRRILSDRIAARHGVGFVVGVVGPARREVISAGGIRRGRAPAPTGKTLFEIASITKLFTGVILMEMVLAGEVTLDQPVDDFMPRGLRMPRYSDRKITLLDLATHTSGLPRDADNMTPDHEDDPFEDYTEARMFDFLRGYELTREVGSQYAYSNLGVALLGSCLLRKARTPYPKLVREKVLLPLGMMHTGVDAKTLHPASVARGYDGELEPAGDWHFRSPYVAVGGLRSTADDLLLFLEAAIGLRPSPLKAALDAQLSVKRPKESPAREVAITWHIQHSPGGDVIWHDGGTGGFRSFLGYNPALRTGVVILSNVGDDWGVLDIGYHLLAGDPLAH